MELSSITACFEKGSSIPTNYKMVIGHKPMINRMIMHTLKHSGVPVQVHLAMARG